MKIRLTQIARIGAAVVTVGALVSCNGFLEVKNPGPIEDSQLNALTAVPGFVAGMSGDLSDALDEVVRIAGIASDDLNHGGSYSGEGLWVRGIIHKEDINGQWALMQKARWTAYDRKIIYWTAVSTGYRETEMMKLRKWNFYLNDKPPVISLKPRDSKTKVKGEVPMLLISWLEARKSEGPPIAARLVAGADGRRSDAGGRTAGPALGNSRRADRKRREAAGTGVGH